MIKKISNHDFELEKISSEKAKSDLRKINEIARKYSDGYTETGIRAFKAGLEELARAYGKQLGEGHIEAYTYLYNTWVFAKLAKKAHSFDGAVFRPVRLNEAMEALGEVINTFRKQSIKKLLELKKKMRSKAKAASEEVSEDLIEALKNDAMTQTFESIRSRIEYAANTSRKDPKLAAYLFHQLRSFLYRAGAPYLISEVKELIEKYFDLATNVEFLPYASLKGINTITPDALLRELESLYLRKIQLINMKGEGGQ